MVAVFSCSFKTQSKYTQKKIDITREIENEFATMIKETKLLMFCDCFFSFSFDQHWSLNQQKAVKRSVI